DALCLGCNGAAQLGKQPALDNDNLLLSVEDLGFVLLQLRSRESFGAHQGLLALVIRRSQVQIRLADLDVVPKYAVELHLQRINGRALPFALLDLRDVLLAVAAQVTQ